MKKPAKLPKGDGIPFEVFAGFGRLETCNPIIACEPPEWAAAAHASVVADTRHCLWARNPHNPVFAPSPDPDAWDCDGVLTPHVIEISDKCYMIYAGRKGNEWQTGLAVTRAPQTSGRREGPGP